MCWSTAMRIYDAPPSARRHDRAGLFADRSSTWWSARVRRPGAREAAYQGAATASATGCSCSSSCSYAFGDTFTGDILSFRATGVFSRRFVKSFLARVAVGCGFEIETELTAHALVLELPVAEVDTPYYARLAGSLSKLNTWRDVVGILGTIVKLYRSEQPLGFFSAIGISLGIMSVGIAIPIFVTYCGGRAWSRACRRRCCPPA